MFFLQFLVDILPLGSGSVDPHIFADPDPGSQNLADPTDPSPDPDPKHWLFIRSNICKRQQFSKSKLSYKSFKKTSIIIRECRFFNFFKTF